MADDIPTAEKRHKAPTTPPSRATDSTETAEPSASAKSVKSVAPSAPAAAPAKPAATAPPPPPAPKPTGDYAMVQDAHHEDVVRYEVLEDGVGVLVCNPDGLFAVAAEVKALGYRILSNLSAYDRADHFGVLYCFVKPAATPAEFGEMRLRVVMPKAAGEPVCPSLEDLYPASNWHEREMFDMYGIKFEGNHDLRRMFLPEGWTGYPMRKDYKEPEQFVAMREGEDIVVRTQEEGSW
ncbi:MAG: NADH-quinone oxidoreductase subunit [Thermoplasmata archaeon]|jgi:NADH:ubiquinone oxidoreductase subunit C|nr:NADH-quinone oxidoreductase subunit [Thermoplasmata archaeon]